MWLCMQVTVVDASQFLATLSSYDSVADRKLGASETDERTLAHLLIDQVGSRARMKNASEIMPLHLLLCVSGVVSDQKNVHANITPGT